MTKYHEAAVSTSVGPTPELKRWLDVISADVDAQAAATGQLPDLYMVGAAVEAVQHALDEQCEDPNGWRTALPGMASRANGDNGRHDFRLLPPPARDFQALAGPLVRAACERVAAEGGPAGAYDHLLIASSRRGQRGITHLLAILAMPDTHSLLHKTVLG